MRAAIIADNRVESRNINTMIVILVADIADNGVACASYIDTIVEVLAANIACESTVIATSAYTRICIMSTLIAYDNVMIRCNFHPIAVSLANI